MNKYQKKLHTEVKEFAKLHRDLNYKEIRKTFKIIMKINPFTPCEDCDNMYCHNKYKNKIVYCKDQR